MRMEANIGNKCDGDDDMCDFGQSLDFDKNNYNENEK